MAGYSGYSMSNNAVDAYEGYLRFDVRPHKKSNSHSRIDVCKFSLR